MNETGFKNYIMNEAFDDEIIELAQAFGEANYYEVFQLYPSLNSILEATNWNAEQLAWQLEDVDTNADYFRFNGQGNLESINSGELVDEIKEFYLDSISRWIDSAPGYVYQNFSYEVKDFLEQNDPYELLKDIHMRYEDLGIVGDVKQWSPYHHEYEVTLTSEKGEETFSYICNPEQGFLPTRTEMIDVVLTDQNMLEDYSDLYSFAEANGLYPDDENDLAAAQELSDLIEENYEKLLNVIDEDDIEAVAHFLNDVKQGRYPDISWDNLTNLDSMSDQEKKHKSSFLDVHANEVKEVSADLAQDTPSRNIDMNAR